MVTREAKENSAECDITEFYERETFEKARVDNNVEYHEDGQSGGP